MMIDDLTQITLSQCVALNFLNFHLINFPLSLASPRESQLLFPLRNVVPVPTLLEDVLWNVEAKVREEAFLPLPNSDCLVPSHFLLSNLHSRSSLVILALSYLGQSSGS